jgi:hypothetical protein
VLNRVEEARKSTGTLNSLLCSKHISLNTEKRIFYAVVESDCEIWAASFLPLLIKSGPHDFSICVHLGAFVAEKLTCKKLC